MISLQKDDLGFGVDYDLGAKIYYAGTYKIGAKIKYQAVKLEDLGAKAFYAQRDHDVQCHIDGTKVVGMYLKQDSPSMVSDIDYGERSFEILEEIAHHFDLYVEKYELNKFKGNIHVVFRFKKRLSWTSKQNFQKIVREWLIETNLILKEDSSKIEIAIKKLRLPGSFDYKSNMYNSNDCKLINVKQYLSERSNHINDTKGLRSGLRIQVSKNKASKGRSEEYIAKSSEKIRENLAYGPGSNVSEWMLQIASHTKNYYQDYADYTKYLEMIILHNGDYSGENSKIALKSWNKNKETHENKIQLTKNHEKTKHKSKNFRLLDYQKEYLSNMLKVYFNNNGLVTTKRKEVLNDTLDLYEKYYAFKILDDEKPGYSGKFINSQLKGSNPLTEPWLENNFKKTTKTMRRYLSYLEAIGAIKLRYFYLNKNSAKKQHCIFGDSGVLTLANHYSFPNLDSLYQKAIEKANSQITKENSIAKIKPKNRTATKLEVTNKNLVADKDSKWSYISKKNLPKGTRDKYYAKLTENNIVIYDEQIYNAKLFACENNEDIEKFLENTRIEPYKLDIWNKYGKSKKLDDTNLKIIANRKIFRKKAKITSKNNKSLDTRLTRIREEKLRTSLTSFVFNSKFIKINYFMNRINKIELANKNKSLLKKNNYKIIKFFLYSYIYKNYSELLDNSKIVLKTRYLQRAGP